MARPRSWPPAASSRARGWSTAMASTRPSSRPSPLRPHGKPAVRSATTCWTWCCATDPAPSLSCRSLPSLVSGRRVKNIGGFPRHPASPHIQVGEILQRGRPLKSLHLFRWKSPVQNARPVRALSPAALQWRITTSRCDPFFGRSRSPEKSLYVGSDIHGGLGDCGMLRRHILCGLQTLDVRGGVRAGRG